MFCTKCGNNLPNDASFCGKCGQPTNITTPSQTQQTSPPQQQGQQTVPNTGEHVFMVLNTNRKYSMFKVTPCYIVFMQDKLVLAYLSKERQKLENDRLSKEIKASGKGFFKGSAAMMGYWSNYHKKYYDMSSSQILSEEADNMLIYYNSISQLLFHAYYSSIDSDGSNHSTGGKLHISVSGGETLKFSHSIGNDKSIKETLMQLLGPRLKFKR